MVETIRYSKLYLEDLARGSGSEVVTLPDGQAVALTRINLATLAGVTFAAGDLLYATGAGSMTNLALGASGTVLVGGASAPSWSASPTLTTITCTCLKVVDDSGNVIHRFGDPDA